MVLYHSTAHFGLAIKVIIRDVYRNEQRYFQYLWYTRKAKTVPFDTPLKRDQPYRSRLFENLADCAFEVFTFAAPFMTEEFKNGLPYDPKNQYQSRHDIHNL